jgi:hypothetical protein
MTTLSDRPETGLVLEAITGVVRGVTDLAEARIPESFASRSFIVLTYDSHGMHTIAHSRKSLDMS